MLSSAALHTPGNRSACCRQLFPLPTCFLHSTHGSLLKSCQGSLDVTDDGGKSVTRIPAGHAATAGFTETPVPLYMSGHMWPIPIVQAGCQPANGSLNPQRPGPALQGPLAGLRRQGNSGINHTSVLKLGSLYLWDLQASSRPPQLPLFVFKYRNTVCHPLQGPCRQDGRHGIV